jgi:hypothetical protein
MRGCLFILVLAAAVVSGVAWFGSPVLASTVIANALQNSGFHAATSTITATADPPPRLLTGHADRVEIVGTDVDVRTFHAASLDLVLTEVDFLARTASRISGRIVGAELKTSAGERTSADVDIDGGGSAAAATIRVDAATVDRVVKAAFLATFGATVTSTALVAPDTLRISASGATITGRLVIDGSGAIALTTALGSAPILGLDPSFPLRLSAVHAEAGSLRIDATLDAEALLGGS